VGGLIDGFGMYPTQGHEQYTENPKEQTEIFLENFPQIKGMDIYYITAKCDRKTMKEESSGIFDIVKRIKESRTDLHHIGDGTKTLVIPMANGKKNLKCLMINEPKTRTYTTSYYPQNVIDAISGGDKPDIILFGADHISDHLINFRGIDAFQVGSFIEQTPHMKANRKPSNVGGWYINFCFDDITNSKMPLTTTYKPFYKRDGVNEEHDILLQKVRNRAEKFLEKTIIDFCPKDIKPREQLKLLRDISKRQTSLIKGQERQIDEMENTISTVGKKSEEYYANPTKDDEIMMALVSDVHIGHENSQIEALNNFAEMATDLGVKYWLDAGDALDSVAMRDEQPFEQKLIKLTDQLQTYKEEYPKLPNVQKFAITGNHPSSMKRRGMLADPGKLLSNYRPDIKIVGDSEGSVYIPIEGGKRNVRYLLKHPRGGSSESQSYILQKIIKRHVRKEQQNKAHDIFVGHYHIAYQLAQHMNVGGLMAGCFEGSTEFLNSLSLYPDIGGWIIKTGIGDHTNETTATFVPMERDKPNEAAIKNLFRNA
jgi:hypothetical protein